MYIIDMATDQLTVLPMISCVNITVIILTVSVCTRLVYVERTFCSRLQRDAFVKKCSFNIVIVLYHFVYEHLHSLATAQELLLIDSKLSSNYHIFQCLL